jgi:hypothetical protein
MREKIKGEEGAIEYVKRYTFDSSDARIWSAVVHVAMFMVLTITCLAIVFS